MVQKGREAAADRSQHCHTCRRQRLRCDGVRPTCNKCLARGVDCLGYGTQALLWVQPQSKPTSARAGQQKQQQQEVVSTEARQGRTTTELALPDGEGLELTRKPKATHLNAYRRYMKMRGFRDEYLQPRNIVLRPVLDPKGYQRQRLIIDSLRYCNAAPTPDPSDSSQAFAYGSLQTCSR